MGTVRYRSMRGIAYSRIEGKEREGVGNSEFKVDDLCWPQGYTQYYLKDHKVLPTKRFYEKINALFDKFIPGEGSGTTDHQNGTTDPQNGVTDLQNGATGTGNPVLTSLAVCSVLGIIWWKWSYIRSWFCSKKHGPRQENPQVGPQRENGRVSQPDSNQTPPASKAAAQK